MPRPINSKWVLKNKFYADPRNEYPPEVAVTSSPHERDALPHSGEQLIDILCWKLDELTAQPLLQFAGIAGANDADRILDNESNGRPAIKHFPAWILH